MITEQFVNACCRVILSENDSIAPSLITDINEIISNIKENDIPLLFRKKFQLLTTLIQLKVDNPSISKNSLLDSVLTTGYFKDIDNFINGINQLDLTNEQVLQCVDSISQRKNMLSIEKNGQHIEKYLEKLKSNSFKNSDEANIEWQRVISNAHTDIINKERNKKLHDITDLDLLSDDYEPVVNQIKLSYSGANSISTGYDCLDDKMYGGFAPARLYMFCAPSGGGKSVMLINLIKNAVERNLRRNDDSKAVYVYVTLENLIDESLVRIYSCLTGKTTQSIIDNYEKEKKLIPQTIKTWLSANNCTIKFAYRKPNLTNCFDILSFCDEVKSENPNYNIRGIYIDYLDLMKPNISSRNSDVYRLELGQISTDLKTLAVLLRVPVITCTQVNRSAYDPKNKMNLANVSESMKKVDNADWIGMIQPREEEDDKSGAKHYNSDIKLMDCKVTKSRFGQKDFSVLFRANFSKFKFEEVRNGSGMDVDSDLNQLSEESIVSDKITQTQTGIYTDDDSDFNVGGFL